MLHESKYEADKEKAINAALADMERKAREHSAEIGRSRIAATLRFYRLTHKGVQ